MRYRTGARPSSRRAALGGVGNSAAMRLPRRRAQTALILVFGEKRVLHRTVELVSHMWSLLLVEGWHP